jgi:hypothetical protein
MTFCHLCRDVLVQAAFFCVFLDLSIQPSLAVGCSSVLVSLATQDGHDITMTDDSPSTRSAGVDGKALLSAVVAVLLLVLITPLRPLRLPVLIVLLAAVVAFGFRRALRFNRTLGVGLIAIIITGLCVHLVLIYRGETQHEALLKQLEQYGEVSVRRYVFPIPYVHQLSVGGDVSDSDLSSILRLDGLDRISDLYLKSDALTDASLQEAGKLKELQYIFIDCDKISDDAILQFMARFPDCTVIPYKRNLHGEPEVFLGPPAEE